ncbi:MAG: ABC transporter ATP-binding protein [Candidatus Paceibacterota bacterium]|jgi:ABC-type multidrug transport system fused ATPase/permease subunit
MKNPLIYLFKKMWEYSRGNHRNVILYIILSISSNLIYALEPLVVGLFLNTVQSQGVNSGNLSYLLFVLSLLMVIELCVWALHGPSRIMESSNAFFVRRKYKNYLLNGTMALPVEWHADHHSGDTIDKIEKGTSALFNFSERTFEIIETAILLIFAFGVMLFFDPLAGAVAFGMTITVFFVLTIFDRKLVPGYSIVNLAENRISEKIFDVLSNITTIIILRVEPLVLKAIDNYIKAPFAQFNLNNGTNEWKWFFASLFGRILMITVVIIYLVSHMASGTILVGTIYIIYGYANRVRETFFRFAYLYNDLVRYRASISNTEELSKDFHSTMELAGNKRLPKKWSKLKIANLSFAYNSEDKNNLHLDNVSMDITKGERVALIGESGGGKTTFLKVVRDLYQPKDLKLFVDDKLVLSGFANISDSISLVPQDPEIFATTIRENLTLGVEYTDTHLKVFTDMACFTQVVEKLPKKMESSIVEKGVNLSGGERQRLALARGLLASTGKDIILLDEPTSSVDFQNELNIFKNVFSSFPKQAIIASVHRLHLLSLFDKVYFFDDGKIIASGTFEELEATSPKFRALWKKYIKTRDTSA